MSQDQDRDQVSEKGSDEGPVEDGLEPFRHVPVGTNDPNIVGEVGPYDVPPGSDRHDKAELSVETVDIDDVDDAKANAPAE